VDTSLNTSQKSTLAAKKATKLPGYNMQNIKRREVVLNQQKRGMDILERVQ